MFDYFFSTVSEAQDITLASKMTAQAMINTKSYVEIFRGDVNSRLSTMDLFFQKNIQLVAKKTPDCLHYNFSEDGNSLECFFMLVPSNGAQFTLYEKVVMGGILEFVYRNGVSLVLRLIKASDFYDGIQNELMGNRKYFSLQRMVVSPDKQGQGIGSKCLAKALKIADAAKLPVVLSTQDERNIVFYQRR